MTRQEAKTIIDKNVESLYGFPNAQQAISNILYQLNDDGYFENKNIDVDKFVREMCKMPKLALLPTINFVTKQTKYISND